MPTTKQNTKKESWLRRKIGGWHAFVVDLLHWGPLAIREIVDNWCLAIRPRRTLGGGHRVADPKLHKKLDHGADGSLNTKVLRSIADLLFLMVLVVAAPLIVFIDCRIIGHGVPECSVTETTQEALILFSAVLFWHEAWRRPQSRGFLVLVGGLFACMFIRELDFAFDVIQHGFWLYPAILTAIASMACAVLYRKTLLPSMAGYFNSRSCIYISIGLLIVIVFSRLFASGQFLWSDIMGADYRSEYKTILQEGLELFGYMFIFFGSCLLPRE